MNPATPEDQQLVPGYGWLPKTLRRWWFNTGAEPDAEIAAIDQLEDALVPLDTDTAHIRELIGRFEACHHKALRHAEIIIEAIATGHTTKAPGKQEHERPDPRELEYQALIETLSAWCAGSPASDTAGRQLLALLGDATPLKVWQVQQVLEKIRRFQDPEARWNQAYENVVDIEHPGSDREFRDRTLATIIHDTEDGQPATITLAAAIDYITGCSWDFIETVKTILAAIAGQLHAQRPLALHSRNLALNPARDRMRVVSSTLMTFCEGRQGDREVDECIVSALGEKTPIKHWLAASLGKTIRLQLGL
jgi:hypothetical protein